MSPTHERPLSPHLTIWKWGPAMAVSILHRITGSALAVAGLGLLAWWLAAIAGGDESYARFEKFIGFEWSGIPLVLVLLAGLVWAFWQHLFSGLRHLVLDTGAGYELKVNRFWSVMVVVGAIFASAATLYLLVGVGE
ncbi:MAG TPA: succinate dehydrogenase, cytochrome b556 subunit [Sphingomicrobium sp.]|nr:succinate dehydrogenase, cytochrome b556 subunit [Sphingomicrobium sp.]